MMRAAVLGVCACVCVVVVVVGAAPARTNTRTYDQRQTGELNIHAQLDNIVIVVIPSSRMDLLALGKNKYDRPEKFLEIFQKPHKDIDRYEVDVESNDVGKPEEEEVVATVEEMKEATDPPKVEATEDTPVKEHSTVAETVQESVVRISIPLELKDAVKKVEEQTKPEVSKNDEKRADSVEPKDPAKESEKPVEKEPTSKQPEDKPPKESPANHSEEKPTPEPPVKPVKPTSSSKEQQESSLQKDQKKESSESSESSEDGPTLEDLIKPVATPAKEVQKKTAEGASKKAPEDSSKKSPEENSTKKASLVEGARKEKVIRYKPDTKWAPGLVELLGPQRRGEEERARYGPLCAPGSWDPELKTCIMPGETRSRNELARFLEAMRFGIALPKE